MVQNTFMHYIIDAVQVCACELTKQFQAGSHSSSAETPNGVVWCTEEGENVSLHIHGAGQQSAASLAYIENIKEATG